MLVFLVEYGPRELENAKIDPHSGTPSGGEISKNRPQNR